jgi:hypothetical protein
MTNPRHLARYILFWILIADAVPSAPAADSKSASIVFVEGQGRLAIVIDGLPVAMYCFNDEQISRPYFAHVRAPSGIQVTRHHPPIEGQDRVDHGELHPGIWMAFGDISGSDYWRLKARVKHVEFAERPADGTGQGSFAVRNHYLDQQDQTRIVCQELARYTFMALPAGYLFLWDSTFSSDGEFVFGDQEEMGLGFRVATPLRAATQREAGLPPGTGTILDSLGRKNGDQVWGNTADWCDYSGTIAGQRVGLTLFCHPKNFRPSRFHARDYGFLTANPFGQQAFRQGEKSAVAVRPGEKLRLRYGVLIHSRPDGSGLDIPAAYQDYLQLTGD